MKRAYTLVLAVVALSFLVFDVNNVYAQNTTKGDTEKEEEDIVLWVLSAPDGFYLDRLAPNYYTTNAKGDFAIAAGAHLRMVTSADFGGIINNTTDEGFVIPYIPTNPVGQARSQVIFNPFASKMYVRGAGMLANGRKVEGYVSINFMGDNNNPELDQAYVKMYNFTIGKTWNMISDINTSPPTIDWWGPSGFTGSRNALIRYENKISNCFSYGVGIEMPIVNALYGSEESAIKQSVPDMAGYIQYNWGQNKMSSVRLSTLYRQMYYYNLNAAESQSQPGYGAQLSGKSKLFHKMHIFYRAMAGFGIASYINDISVVAVDLLPRFTSDGEMTNIGAYGWYLGGQYDISEKIFVSATYSQSRVYARGNMQPDPNDYKYSQYIVANCFWKLDKNTQLAVEVLMGTKTNFDSSRHNANRLNLLMQYNF